MKWSKFTAFIGSDCRRLSVKQAAAVLGSRQQFSELGCLLLCAVFVQLLY